MTAWIVDYEKQSGQECNDKMVNEGTRNACLVGSKLHST